MARTKTKKTKKPETIAEHISSVSDALFDIGMELWWLIFVAGFIIFMVGKALDIWRF